MTKISDLVQGVVVETRTQSWLGAYFYSDKIDYSQIPKKEHAAIDIRMQPILNVVACIPIIGRFAGITRMALAVIHTVSHLLAALVTLDKGHCYHAAKGGCEFLRGLIESIPIIGRVFANYYYHTGDWWILKIYNPNHPDSLDRSANLWQNVKKNRPAGYITV